MSETMQPEISIMAVVSPLDWFVFGAVLVATGLAVLAGHILKRKTLGRPTEQENFLDLLVMGRRLTLPMFVATLVATWYGGIFGVTEMAFTYGIYNWITQGVFWYVAYLIFAFFIVKRVAAYEAVTLPDLVGRMFGPRSGRLSAVFTLFKVLPIAYAISIGLFLQILFGGELWVMMCLGVALVLLYAMWGGLRAVVFSDLVQFFVMCLAVLLVLVLSVHRFGGLSFLRANLPAAQFSPTGGNPVATMLVWGFVALATLADPNFYQRCFAARSVGTAKWGILLATLVWIGFDICTTFGAMYARAAIPDAVPNHAYVVYALQLLPNGLRGFLLAGVAAVILSTLDSYLFLAGTTASYDLMPRRLQGRVNLHRLGMITTGAASILLGVLFKGNIRETWKTLGSYAAACLLLPLMLGYLFPGRIRDNQFVFAALLGVIGTTVWRLVERQGFWAQVDPFYAGLLCTASGLGSYGVWRRLSGRPAGVTTPRPPETPPPGRL